MLCAGVVRYLLAAETAYAISPLVPSMTYISDPITHWYSFFTFDGQMYSGSVCGRGELLQDSVHVSLLAEIEDSVLSISSYSHAEVVAARAKVGHKETISEAPLIFFISAMLGLMIKRSSTYTAMYMLLRTNILRSALTGSKPRSRRKLVSV
jgi:hypothetical protein